MASAIATAPADIPESEAQGQIKTIYEDMKKSFRMPMVSPVFRRLAGYPDFLQLAWRQLHPNVQTVYFENRASAIRSRATKTMATLAQAPPADSDVANALKVFQYANPKIFIAIAALRSAVNGQYPKLETLSAEEKRPIPTGIPQGESAPETMDLDSASEELHAILADMSTTLGVTEVGSEYYALARWPAYLDTAWQALKPAIQQPEYSRLVRDLRLIAEETILVMPFRIEINPHVMRLCGMSEHDIDGIRAILTGFYRQLPGLIANISALSMGAPEVSDWSEKTA